MRMLANASLATEEALDSACEVSDLGFPSLHELWPTLVNLVWNLRIKGSNIDTVKPMNKTTEHVTRESAQFLVKATTRAAIISELYSTNTPSFSDIPNCKVLLVAVMVPVA